jgi:anion-transporting  ArsA/GET3 family ATPase
VSDELPSSLEDELAQLNVLSDESLWRIARSRLNPLQAAKLEHLHLKAQRQPLTATERKQEQIVVHEYERVLLLRARAARLLKDHGIDISSLFN